jgi:hypothetical protein
MRSTEEKRELLHIRKKTRDLNHNHNPRANPAIIE